MKAILVIDVPEDMRIEDTRALHLTLFNGMFTKDIKIDCPLKPMPERFETTILTNYCLGIENGWNACLDAITGETE